MAKGAKKVIDPRVEGDELAQAEVPESLAAQLRARATEMGMALPDLLRRLVQGLDNEVVVTR